MKKRLALIAEGYVPVSAPIAIYSSGLCPAPSKRDHDTTVSGLRHHVRLQLERSSSLSSSDHRKEDVARHTLGFYPYGVVEVVSVSTAVQV